jgi:ATP-dependent RNA helicase RhlE
VDSISHVINFDMPDTADAYIHRIGRTGRAERTGDAFTLVTPDDDDMVRTLEKIMGHKLERQTLKGFDYTAPTPPRIAPAPRKPKRPAASSPREAEPRHLRRQHAQAGNKSNKRY